MGDINKDGYEGEHCWTFKVAPCCQLMLSKALVCSSSDIAVSAPYEGSGVVYIYHSMADGSGLNLESVQVRTSNGVRVCMCMECLLVQ